MKKLIFLAACGFCGLLAAASNDTRINLLDYKALVTNVGTETEDWQPAFRQAIEAAQNKRAPLYVPAGDYRIRQAIQVPPPKGPKNLLGYPVPLRIVGDGSRLSVIQQQVESENVIDWSGPSYKESLANGSIQDVALAGRLNRLHQPRILSMLAGIWPSLR